MKARPRSKAARLAAVAARLQSEVVELQALVADEESELRDVETAGEQYLSLDELCSRMPYRPQTIRNLMVQGVLRNGEHYVQRQPHGKVMFIWSAMERWLHERRDHAATQESFVPTHNARTRKIR